MSADGWAARSAARKAYRQQKDFNYTHRLGRKCSSCGIDIVDYNKQGICSKCWRPLNSKIKERERAARAREKSVYVHKITPFEDDERGVSCRRVGDVK